MADKHEHTHDGHDHGHDHDHGPMDHVHFEFHDDPAKLAAQEADPAARSLSDALRVSFKLLSVVMILALAGLLLTGMRQIQTEQRGLRFTFGALQGEGDDAVLGPGLRWSWPQPIGKIVALPTGDQEMEITDFWMNEKPEEVQQPLKDRTPSGEGLRVGLDGALLTADRGLIHVKIKCKYTYQQRDGQPDPKALLEQYRNIGDVKETIRSAVCTAAITAAAQRTVDSIYYAGQEEFAAAVADLAQKRLDAMRSGLKVRIFVPTATVPLAAIAAFDAVPTARAEADKTVTDARTEAANRLNGAAGTEGARLLAGDPDHPDQPGLLAQYARLREQKKEQEAESVLQQIYAVLTDSAKTKGQAYSIINDALTYKQTIASTVKARAEKFRQLYDQYRKTPEVLVQNELADARAAILYNKLIEVYMAPISDKMVLKINQDPDVIKAITQSLLKKAKEAP